MRRRLSNVGSLLSLVLLLVVVGLVVAVAVVEGEELPRLAARGDAAAVQKALLAGEDKDSLGRTALWHAASIGNKVIVQQLLRHNAQVAVASPDGTTPLLAATLGKHAEVVRHLLVYGASPDTVNKQGTLPRTYAVVHELEQIEQLFEQHFRQGVAAFEDPPGTWKTYEAKDQGGQRYFWNSRTGEIQWLRPPSCAWQRFALADGRTCFHNNVTQQTVYTTPNALAWKRVRDATDHSGQTCNWFNYRANVMQRETPAELPEDWQKEGKLWTASYHNRVLNLTQWEDPSEGSWRECCDAQGLRFWFKGTSGELTYQQASLVYWLVVSPTMNETSLCQRALFVQPASMAWLEVDNSDTLQRYYYNMVTDSITWGVPVDAAWVENTRAD
eukprot:jgi/Chlat1/3846/Chrsp26S04058